MRLDRLEAMAVLRAVVEKGSFTGASKALGMPLASVSRKVGELEAHLGTRLLARSTRRLALTDAGLAYIQAAKRILDEVAEAERAAAGEYRSARGELAVTAPLLFGRLHILPIVTEFLAINPDVNVRLLLSDRNLHLIDDQVDLGVRIGRLPDSDLITTRVGSMRTILCAAPSFLAAHGTPRHPSNLASLPCIGFNMQAATTSWTFSDPKDRRRIEVPITPRLSATTAEAVASAAERGVGVTRVYHYQVAEALRIGTLQVILPEFEVEPAPVQLIHAGREMLPLKTRVFLDFAAAGLRKILKTDG